MRNRFAPLLSFLFILVFLLCPQAAGQGVSTGIKICLESALPALFPFFVASALLTETGGAWYLTRVLYKPFWRLFGLEANGASALVLGMLGGYPVGPATVATLLREQRITCADASRLMGFCSIASPAFCINLCGIFLFGSAKIGLLLYLLQVASALLTGLLLTRRPKSKVPPSIPSPPKGRPRSFAACFCRAVIQAAKTSVTVCAFLVIFCVLLALLSPMLGEQWQWPIIASLAEVTTGVILLPELHLPAYLLLPLVSVLLGFGGLSVQFQSHAFLEPYEVPMRRYTLGRLLQALLSGALTLMLCQLAPQAIAVSGSGGVQAKMPHWGALVCFLLVVFLSLKPPHRAASPDE